MTAKALQSRCSSISSARPAGIAGIDLPLPGRALSGGEVVVVAPGEGLQRNQSRVVFEQDASLACRLDLRLGGAPRAFPAERRAIEPVAISTQPRVGRRSMSCVKAVVRRPAVVRCGPAATAQLSRRQRRKSTGTRGRPEGPARPPGPAPSRAPGGRAASRRPGRAGGGGRHRADAGRRPSAWRAPRQGASGVDFPARRHGGDRGQQQSAISAASPACSTLADPRSRSPTCRIGRS